MAAVTLSSTLIDVVRPQIFKDAIDAAKGEGKDEDIHLKRFGTKESKWFGAFLSVYSVEEYESKQCFLTRDRFAGFAIYDRDIISVFKNPRFSGKALEVIIPKAVEVGGRRLDCFNGRLPTLYSEFGFEPVAKLKFNKQFAPEDWNYDRDEQPDIIFMVYQATILGLFEKTSEGTHRRIAWVNSKIEGLSYCLTYEDGQEIQKKLLQQNS